MTLHGVLRGDAGSNSLAVNISDLLQERSIDRPALAGSGQEVSLQSGYELHNEAVSHMDELALSYLFHQGRNGNLTEQLTSQFVAIKRLY